MVKLIIIISYFKEFFVVTEIIVTKISEMIQISMDNFLENCDFLKKKLLPDKYITVSEEMEDNKIGITKLGIQKMHQGKVLALE